MVEHCTTKCTSHRLAVTRLPFQRQNHHLTATQGAAVGAKSVFEDSTCSMGWSPGFELFRMAVCMILLLESRTTQQIVVMGRVKLVFSVPTWGYSALGGQGEWDRLVSSAFRGCINTVVWCGVVWCGVVWCGVVWRGVAWRGVAWRGVAWCGVVWCGVVWCGVVWCGVVWCGVVWRGVAWCTQGTVTKRQWPGCLACG